VTEVGIRSPRPGSQAKLCFYYGPMNSGKSTLAIQTMYNFSCSERKGMLFSRFDRSGSGFATSRIGLRTSATDFEGLDFRQLVADREELDHLVIDEAQFLDEEQVEQLADVVDHNSVDVFAFGLASDFRSLLFSGSKRLLELADYSCAVQLRTLCWCGDIGLLSGRISGGRLLIDGPTVLVDTIEEAGGYQVLCRRHYRSGKGRPPHSPSGP